MSDFPQPVDDMWTNRIVEGFTQILENAGLTPIAVLGSKISLGHLVGEGAIVRIASVKREELLELLDDLVFKLRYPGKKT